MNTITMLAADLRRTLLCALPFVDREEIAHPQLAALWLEAGGGTFAATGTDRYTLGHARASADGNLDSGVLLSRERAQLLADALRLSNNEHIVTLNTDRRGWLEATTEELSLKVRLFNLGRDGWLFNYSKLFGIFAEPITIDLSEPIGINPDLTRRFARVQEITGLRPVRWTFAGAMKPIRVEIGSTFVGLIMPSRLNEHSTRDMDWPVPVGVKTPEAVQA